MAIDPYTLCPGGTGKKVKFCCPDLLSELEKVQKMLEGNQRQACLEYIEQLEARHPDRACLLTTTALLQGQLGNPEEAQKTVGKVLESQPENPVDLAEQALLAIDATSSEAAIEPLQRAIAASKDKMPYKVFEVLGILSQALLADGHLVAALAHAGLQMRINPKHEPALEFIVRVISAPVVPLLFKDMPRPFDSGPVAPALQAGFESALDAAQHSRWLEAAQKFARLAEQAPRSAPICHNLGLLRSYLADEGGAARFLHRYATLDVALDDAIEAEALAQLIAPAEGAQVDLVFLEFAIKDFDQLQSRLGTDRRAEQLSGDEFQWDEPDQPPPRASFWILDRPMPATAEGLSPQDVPESLAQLFLFGRETDREARLEMSAYRDQLDAAKARLAEIAGDALGAAGEETVISSTSLVQRSLSWNWRLPYDVSIARLRELTLERQRHSFFEVWPQTPNPAIDGKKPAEAARDPAQKIKLLAAIMVLESSSNSDVISFDELTAQLGLPVAGDIDPTGLDVRDLPLVRLHRLMVEKLSDDDLLHVYQRAVLPQARRAMRRIIAEVVARPSLNDKVDKAQAYGFLASLSDQFDQRLYFLNLAREAAEASGRSSAPWDLEEFILQLGQGNSAEAERLLRHIQTAHGKEPGVMQRLTQMLYQAGIIDERGRPVGRPSEEPAG